VLSRELAESGHFPAIDIERSASRVMHNVADGGHIDDARRFRQLWSRYSKARDLIQLGAYTPGGDHDLDLAVRLHPHMVNLLQQDMHTPSHMHDSLAELHQIVSG
jgi:flagellum-specific ATP synthase